MPWLHGVYYFNIGLCLENMLKGVLCYRNPDLIAGTKIDRKIKHHRLKELALMTGLNFSVDEKSLLNFLTTYVRWFGRYPIPADSAETVGTVFAQYLRS